MPLRTHTRKHATRGDEAAALAAARTALAPAGGRRPRGTHRRRARRGAAAACTSAGVAGGWRQRVVALTAALNSSVGGEVLLSQLPDLGTSLLDTPLTDARKFYAAGARARRHARRRRRLAARHHRTRWMGRRRPWRHLRRARRSLAREPPRRDARRLWRAQNPARYHAAERRFDGRRNASERVPSAPPLLARFEISRWRGIGSPDATGCCACSSTTRSIPPPTARRSPSSPAAHRPAAAVLTDADGGRQVCAASERDGGRFAPRDVCAEAGRRRLRPRLRHRRGVADGEIYYE